MSFAVQHNQMPGCKQSLKRIKKAEPHTEFKVCEKSAAFRTKVTKSNVSLSSSSSQRSQLEASQTKPYVTSHKNPAAF